MEKVKVSVCMITYNHEAFIADAIESVMMQEGDFEIELVIGEDLSVDNTIGVINRYKSIYGDKIKVIKSTINVGSQRNFIRTFLACSGDYIAMLEGDDYWIDSKKIQSQIKALEEKPTCAMCIHDATIFTQGKAGSRQLFSEKFSSVISNFERIITRDELIDHGWFIPTASILLRRSAVPANIPRWFENVFSGDYILQLLITEQGDILYIPYVMSEYRLHDKGATHSGFNEKRIKMSIDETKYIKTLISPIHWGKFDTNLQNFYFSLCLNNKHNLAKYAYYYFKAITVNKDIFQGQIKRIIQKLI